MKLIPLQISRARTSGMTLIEVMFAVVLMGVVIAGVLSANFLGLRENRLMESKAGANDSARRYINQLIYDIRSAKGYDIGNLASTNYSVTNFVTITNGTMVGPALKLYMLTISSNAAVDPSSFIMYFFDTTQTNASNGKLWRVNNTNGAVPTVIISNLINTLYFASEDYLGSNQTVRTYKGVIHTTLQFSQFQYPLTSIGSNGLFDYYRIECRATPHVPDGS